MALIATHRCLADAGMKPEDIDFIIVATLSPDYGFPASAQFLHGYLDIPPRPAIDVHAQCSGFLYALTLADQCIRTGLYNNVLVIGSDTHSTALEFADRGRHITVLFGDGAGAVMLTAAEEGDRRLIMNSHLYAEGKNAKKLWIEYPGSKYNPRITKEAIDQGRHFPQMEGRAVFNSAITRMPEVLPGGAQGRRIYSQSRFSHPSPGESAHQPVRLSTAGTTSGENLQQYRALRQHHGRHHPHMLV